MISNDCPLCGSASNTILSTKGKEVVVRCECGLVYKRIIDENKETKHYKSGKIWDNDFFENRYKKISSYLWGKIGAKKKILDIGCGNGRMLECVGALFGKSEYWGNEASQPLWRDIKKRKHPIKIVPGRFDVADFGDNKFELIICMGVDYLFLSHDVALQKIAYLMSEGAKLYMERNVFLDMKSFCGKKVKNEDELFWTNMLITTWFTEEQMNKQLQKYFIIEDNFSYGDETTRCVGWMCSRK